MEKIYDLLDLRRVMLTNLAKNYKDNDDTKPHPFHITTFDGDAIRRMFDLVLNRNNLREYRAYIQYCIIGAFKGFTTQDLDEEWFDFYSRKLGGQEKQKPEDKRCISVVNGYAGEMMGKVYVDKFFPSSSKEMLQLMIARVIKVMSGSIQRNDWLTDSTKTKALDKLAKFNVKIGYPDVWKDYSKLNIEIGDDLYTISKKAKVWSAQIHFYDKLNSQVDRNEWGMTPQTVNAYFMPPLNEIVFPAAIIQPPFYNPTRESVDFDISEELEALEEKDTPYNLCASYGGIGAVIAHEITHGYDDKGRLYDGEGNVNDWWTEEDANKFKAKTDIMAGQAEEYKYVNPEDNSEHKMNPQLTMGENLADLGGMSLSLQAMNMHLDESNVSENDKKTCQRIFFKSFANIWKENSKADARINQLTTDPHAPVDFRGNLVRNIDEFYDVFNVKEGDKMYLPPAKRVRMW